MIPKKILIVLGVILGVAPIIFYFVSLFVPGLNWLTMLPTSLPDAGLTAIVVLTYFISAALALIAVGLGVINWPNDVLARAKREPLSDAIAFAQDADQEPSLSLEVSPINWRSVDLIQGTHSFLDKGVESSAQQAAIEQSFFPEAEKHGRNIYVKRQAALEASEKVISGPISCSLEQLKQIAAYMQTAYIQTAIYELANASYWKAYAAAYREAMVKDDINISKDILPPLPTSELVENILEATAKEGRDVLMRRAQEAARSQAYRDVARKRGRSITAAGAGVGAEEGAAVTVGAGVRAPLAALRPAAIDTSSVVTLERHAEARYERALTYIKAAWAIEGVLAPVDQASASLDRDTLLNCLRAQKKQIHSTRSAPLREVGGAYYLANPAPGGSPLAFLPFFPLSDYEFAYYRASSVKSGEDLRFFAGLEEALPPAEPGAGAGAAVARPALSPAAATPSYPAGVARSADASAAASPAGASSEGKDEGVSASARRG